MQDKLPSCILITPARNETQFIEQTIRAVIAKKIRSISWIIVSDSSTEGTDEIVEGFLAENQWIELVRMPERMWGEFYTGMISKLKQKGAWRTSAAGAESWFQNRRLVVVGRDDHGVKVARRGIVRDSRKGVSGLKVRVYNGRGTSENTSCTYVERALSGNESMRFDRGNFAA